MEDYFKFIPVALWVLYKIFGKGKTKEQKPKQRTKQNSRPKTNTATPSIEDILRELSGEKKAVPQKVATPKAEPRTKKIEMVDHQYDFRPEYEHHADTGRDLKEIKAEIKESKHISTKQHVKNFNLREAIITQTILNRPEF